MPWSSHTSFPHAILHIDGDSFFVSCEAAVNPSLKGKPVITGRERGIVSSASYEAKALGITRGMILSEVKKICPDAIILPSDYETYSLFSARMYAIVRRYTPDIEEYSIDECFADLTGLRAPLHMSYRQMAERIKHELDTELGMTFSVGLAPNKVLAKVASKWNKPSGLTIIPQGERENFLRELPAGSLWGIGRQTSTYLAKMRIYTALEFAKAREGWVRANLNKPYQEIWAELNGSFVYPLNLETVHHAYQSISKTKTFTPPSRDRTFIFSQLAKNVENACIKARRHELAAPKVFFFLKTQSFRFCGLELTFSVPVSTPTEIIRRIHEHFDKVYRPKAQYRATGVVLMNLVEEGREQLDLFGATTDLLNWRQVYAAVDELDQKFGKHTVFLASTMSAIKNTAHQNERGDAPTRATHLLPGENNRQLIGIPLLGTVK